MMKPLRIAATYARRSLDLGDSFSIASQDRAMLKLAAEKGCRVPEEFRFVDDGGLGGEADRPAFVRLREAIRAGLVQVVIAHDLDRFVRDLALQLLVRRKLTAPESSLFSVPPPIRRRRRNRECSYS
jgi:DNA invertase Pin-like site-specific DNA recombinase